MEYSEKFKKAVFGGYDRDDVLRCFDEMNTQNEEALADAQKNLDDARRQLTMQTGHASQLETECLGLKTELTKCRAALKQAQQDLADQTRKLEQVTKDMHSLKALNSELSVKRGILEENNRTMKKTIEELQARNTGSQAGFEIGEMMVEAKKAADNIMIRAKNHSDEINRNIDTTISGFDTELSAFRTSITDMQEQIRICTETMNRQLEILNTKSMEAVRQVSSMNHYADEEEMPAPETSEESAGAEEASAEDEEKEPETKNPYSFLFRK